MSKENFDQKKATIEALTDKQVLYPNMPVNVALQEAEDLFVWCATDKEKLEKAGLDWQLVSDLPIRAGACRYIQSEWQKEFRSLEDAQRQWKEKSPVAYELRDELLHHFYFAFANTPDLHARTQAIAEGNSHADMIQDLSDLSVLGKANSSALQAIGVDITLLDKAAEMSDEMADLLALSNGKKQEDNKLRLLRDKAFTYMKVAVDEIRRCGQYVFWKDEQRVKGYVSQYFKRMAFKSANAKAEKVN